MLLSVNFDISIINNYSWSIVVLGFLACFAAFVLLVCLFNIPNLISFFRNIGKPKDPETVKSTKKSIPADVNAAIASAIFLYLNEMHDEENHVITIKRASKTYSPWNSKIYGLNNYLHKK